ncbi:MAG: DNA mismatch repair endonuclease MutL, partial [Chloroflexota bacterium]
IASFGFRGEALPSIAAVAEVSLVTRTAAEVGGTSLVLRDGTVVSQGPQGHPPGTTVTVTGLFRRIPARLKFLKSPATENSQIANVVSQYALAFPEVSFSLRVDGRATLSTGGSGRLTDSIAAVYGLEVARGMLEITGAGWRGGAPRDTIKVDGLIGPPEVSRGRRGYLSLFVNRRWVNSRLLARAVEEAYRGLLPVDRHPVAVINLTVPPDEVDVNVHPTKLEVKFRDESAVFGAVQRAVRQTLLAAAPVPRIEEVAAAYGAPSPTAPWQWPSATDRHHETSPAAPAIIPATALPVLRLIGQLQNSYIIAEGPDGLYLIDQHAAHERVLTEKIEQERAQRGLEVQGLLEPVPCEVSLKQDEVLRLRHRELAPFGFQLEPFGERTYLVRAVPGLLYQKDWRGALGELLGALAEGERTGWEEKAVFSLACHGAVRAGQTLADSEMRELIRQLEQTANPHTCPHGRPTMICLRTERLRREFARD